MLVAKSGTGPHGDSSDTARVKPYIAICGADGVGKSTLCANLARLLDVRAYCEEPMALPEFVRWMRKPTPDTAFQAQLAFLEHAANRQLAAARTKGVVERLLWDNFEVFCRIKAKTGAIRGSDLVRLEDFVSTVAGRMPPPIMTVYLRADYPVLLDRIANRNATYDGVADKELLRAEIESYDRLFSEWSYSPVITLWSDANTQPDVLALDVLANL